MYVAVIIVAVVGLLWWRFLKTYGKIDFWNVVRKHPNEAYEWFMTDDAWIVTDPNDPQSSPPENKDEWNGPSWLFVPMLGGKRIGIYGRYQDMEESMQRFMQRYS